jgi:undecaprenyl-diphosphatase
MTTLEAIIIAIVEGITEFLPISSTGHMIITEKILGVPPDDLTKLFTVSIQFGAILSVLVLYWRRFLQGISFYMKLLIAFIPAAVLGKLFGDGIDRLLESVPVVAIALLLGGFVLLYIDRFLNPLEEKQVTNGKAFTIGLFQCIALIPGVSRSAATIIGGMTQGLTRKQAAEFSFFLAVPTMAAASGYKLLTVWKATPGLFNSENITTLLIGNAVAFVVAVLAIKFLISWLTKHGFRLFGWYRIALGGILLILLAAGVDLQVM